MDESKRLGISAAARACSCSEDTLRRLDKRGVVSPLRDSAGRRLFSDADVQTVRTHLASIPRLGQRDAGDRASADASNDSGQSVRVE